MIRRPFDRFQCVEATGFLFRNWVIMKEAVLKSMLATELMFSWSGLEATFGLESTGY